MFVTVCRPQLITDVETAKIGSDVRDGLSTQLITNVETAKIGSDVRDGLWTPVNHKRGDS